MNTKDRILDTAERLFARDGFEATSLRSITAEAGVNLAAINYHFQSKEALVQAVIGRRMGPMNDRRLALLDAYEAQAATPPTARQNHGRISAPGGQWPEATPTNSCR